MLNTQLAVLGAGPGGAAAAFRAADLGFQVTLIDADPNLGGTCTLRGCIPSKALLHVAKVISEAREATEWGVAFSPPQLDVDVLRARKEKVVQTLSGGLMQLAKRRKVNVIRARGVFVDSQTLRLAPVDRDQKEERLSFEHCIVAAGSKPTLPPAFQIGSPRVMDSTSALELADVPETLLVIGGGYIGLELGTVYAELGSKVSVVELTDGLLPGVDRDLVKPLHTRLEKRLAAIALSTKVLSLAERGDAIEATFEDANGQSKESFARVLVSVGRKPNTSGLGLENTRVEMDARGFIKTDSQQRTADEHILAIGDAAGEPMLAHKAAHQAKVAVEALHGEPATFEPLAIPAVVFTDPEIAWAGLTEDQAQRDGRAVEVSRYPWGASGRAVSLLRTEGLTKLVIDPETQRVLGVGIVGAGAGELIAEGVLAIEMGATAQDIAESIHAHPTLSETLGFSAETYLGTATEVYKPRRKP